MTDLPPLPPELEAELQQHRLAEIRESAKTLREECDQADASAYPCISPWVKDVRAVLELLSLVERLVEFVPVPEFHDGDVKFNGRWFTQASPVLPTQKLLTACEVHDIEPPAWLAEMAKRLDTPPASATIGGSHGDSARSECNSPRSRD